MSTFILHTPLSQMRPIGSEGERSFARITALMARHLSEADAAILADPVPVRDGSGIDWYADIEGDVERLSELSPEEGELVKAKLFKTLTEMRAVADRLDLEGTGKQVAAATALRNASTFPGDEYVFAWRDGADIYPIIVGWGYESHDAALVRDFDISKFGPDRAKQPIATLAMATARQQAQVARQNATVVTDEAPTPRSPNIEAMPTVLRPRMGWGWIIPAIPFGLSLLLLGVVAALLLPACGLRTPFGTVSFGFPSSFGCNSVAAAMLDPSGLNGVSLNNDLQTAKLEYGRQRMICLATQSPQGNPAPVSQEHAFEQRIENRGEAQVTLVWEGSDDLDLAVSCPDRKVVQFTNAQSCGGTLDVDQNAHEVSASPVENVTFAQGLPDAGSYKIFVSLYKSRMNSFPVPFKVRIRDQNGTRFIPGQLMRTNDTVQVGEMTK